MNQKGKTVPNDLTHLHNTKIQIKSLNNSNRNTPKIWQRIERSGGLMWEKIQLRGGKELRIKVEVF